jgi:hypothetical protein
VRQMYTDDGVIDLGANKGASELSEPGYGTTVGRLCGFEIG